MNSPCRPWRYAADANINFQHQGFWKLSSDKHYRQTDRQTGPKLYTMPLRGWSIIIFETMFMVLWSWQIHCKSSSSSCDECRMAPPADQLSYQVNQLGMWVHVWTAIIFTHHQYLLSLLSPQTDTYFTVPQRVDGWVDLDTAWGYAGHAWHCTVQWFLQ